MTDKANPFAVLPSLDAMLRSAALAGEIETRGRPMAVETLRAVIADLRARPADLPETTEAAIALVAFEAVARIPVDFRELALANAADVARRLRRSST